MSSRKAGPMQVVTIKELRRTLDMERRVGRTIGLVPTMGFLHEGHASLMRRAAEETDVVVASIFVNPLQFGPTEDLGAYPRDLERDTRIAAESGVDLLFVPDVLEMYPQPVVTTVEVGELSDRFDGESRPGHFAGVATVVAKLFNIVGACTAYFGEKDFQQLAVVRRMAADLSWPAKVVGCATVRDPDGVALSSRNGYLTPDERAAAPVVHQALQAGVAAVQSGDRDPASVRARMADVVAEEPLAELDYVAVVEANSLAVPEALSGDLRLLAAVRLGRARLIDNVGVTA